MATSNWELIEDDIDTPQKEGNRLKEVRISLGLTITALSKKANVSTKVISQTERFLTRPTPVTKHKIIKGLNLAQSANEKKWKYDEIFF